MTGTARPEQAARVPRDALDGRVEAFLLRRLDPESEDFGLRREAPQPERAGDRLDAHGLAAEQPRDRLRQRRRPVARVVAA